MHLSTVWTWLFWGWLAGEILLAVFTRTRRGEGKVQDRGTKMILWVVIFISISALDSVQRLAPAEMSSGAWIRAVSLALMIVGITIRVAAILTLGKWFSTNVATHASQTLQRSGLYSVVRHPSYLGMEIIFLAIGLHTRNWACLAVVVILPTLAVLYRIHVEEQALLRAFGASYADYSRTTKRLIPGVY